MTDFIIESKEDPELDALDYALLRLRGEPGRESIAREGESFGGPQRNWIRMPVNAWDFQPETALYIVQHPQGRPLQLALETQAVISVNTNRTRVRYRTNTEPGSSGSPDRKSTSLNSSHAS